MKNGYSESDVIAGYTIGNRLCLLAMALNSWTKAFPIIVQDILCHVDHGLHMLTTKYHHIRERWNHEMKGRNVTLSHYLYLYNIHKIIHLYLSTHVVISIHASFEP